MRHYFPFVEYGGPFHAYDVRLACTKPQPLPAHFNLVKVFSAHVWLALIGCFGCTMVLYTFLSLAASICSSSAVNVASDAFYLMSIHFSQSKKLH